MKQVIIGLTAAGVFAAGAIASAEPLKVKPGLWENTTIAQRDIAASRPTNLDQLTPEQRAKVEQQLAARNQQRTVTKACLTQAQIEKNDAFMGGAQHHACKRISVAQTASEWVTKIECSGKAAAAGEVRISAPDEQHMNASIVMTAKNGPKERTTRSEVQARWLGADCAAAKVSRNGAANHGAH
jgi:hypothetical protein